MNMKILSDIKKEAKQMRKDTGTPHMACLDIVAKKYGFDHFHHAQTMAKKHKALGAQTRCAIHTTKEKSE
jgi:hypothetical protein